MRLSRLWKRRSGFLSVSGCRKIVLTMTFGRHQTVQLCGAREQAKSVLDGIMKALKLGVTYGITA